MIGRLFGIARAVWRLPALEQAVVALRADLGEAQRKLDNTSTIAQELYVGKSKPKTAARR